MKTCKKCKQSKPVAQFYKHARLQGGLAHECKVCVKGRMASNYADDPAPFKARAAKYRNAHPEKVKEYQSKYLANRKAIINAIKLESGCVDCGYNADPVALQFDHVRGKKKFDIAQRSTKPMDEVYAEIEKCEVRCANCHAIITHARSGKEVSDTRTPGTRTTRGTSSE